MFIVIVIQLLNLLSMVILVDVLLSWVMRPERFPLNLTRQLTEPLYAPIRSVLDPRRTGGLDLSPLVWIFGIQFVVSALAG